MFVNCYATQLYVLSKCKKALFCYIKSLLYPALCGFGERVDKEAIHEHKLKLLKCRPRRVEKVGEVGVVDHMSIECG